MIHYLNSLALVNSPAFYLSVLSVWYGKAQDHQTTYWTTGLSIQINFLISLNNSPASSNPGLSVLLLGSVISLVCIFIFLNVFTTSQDRYLMITQSKSSRLSINHAGVWYKCHKLYKAKLHCDFSQY